jgi:hypothetical protein
MKSMARKFFGKDSIEMTEYSDASKGGGGCGETLSVGGTNNDFAAHELGNAARANGVAAWQHAGESRRHVAEGLEANRTVH